MGYENKGDTLSVLRREATVLVWNGAIYSTSGLHVPFFWCMKYDSTSFAWDAEDVLNLSFTDSESQNGRSKCGLILNLALVPSGFIFCVQFNRKFPEWNLEQDMHDSRQINAVPYHIHNSNQRYFTSIFLVVLMRFKS